LILDKCIISIRKFKTSADIIIDELFLLNNYIIIITQLMNMI